jgi:hypothetical protein
MPCRLPEQKRQSGSCPAFLSKDAGAHLRRPAGLCVASGPSKSTAPALPPKQNPERQLCNQPDYKKHDEANPTACNAYCDHVAHGSEHEKQQDMPDKSSHCNAPLLPGAHYGRELEWQRIWYAIAEVIIIRPLASGEVST